MDQMFQDKNVTCKQCQAPFVLTAGEQNFFAEKGLTMPGRCKDCRAKNKAEKAGHSGPGDQVQAAPQRPVVIEQPERGGGRHNKGSRRRQFDD